MAHPLGCAVRRWLRAQYTSRPSGDGMRGEQGVQAECVLLTRMRLGSEIFFLPILHDCFYGAMVFFWVGGLLRWHGVLRLGSISGGYSTLMSLHTSTTHEATNNGVMGIGKGDASPFTLSDAVEVGAIFAARQEAVHHSRAGLWDPHRVVQYRQTKTYVMSTGANYRKP
ncbi:hypothetical protein GQ53DRAFT_206310 [Thozetella sp. PMI_491]|nr:hypothetical protein GQ53DRAFT_206310 [Thozetella sp. PMI_491]